MARKVNAAVKEATAKTKTTTTKTTMVKEAPAAVSEEKTAEPAGEAKKAPVKKPAARKASAANPTEVKSSVYVQFAGKEFSEKSLTEAVKEAYTALGNKAEEIRTIDIYVKPEESVAYYAVNGQGSDEFKIEL